jgi:hypothetical protein
LTTKFTQHTAALPQPSAISCQPSARPLCASQTHGASLLIAQRSSWPRQDCPATPSPHTSRQ